MSTAMQHEWLRRLSDYHSGDVDDAEAAAVEEHLAGCEECRQALAVYQRFYVLASSPLQLGEPSSAVAEQLSLNHDASDGFRVGSRLGSYRRDRTHPERNRRLLGIASVLAASLVIVGFLALLGPRIGGKGKHPIPTPYPSATPSGPTPTVQTTNLPAPGTGYTNAGPDWATRLAFAPSSPNTVYACGISTSSAGYGEFLVAVSTDSGHTWRSQASPGILPEYVPATPLPSDLEDSNQCYITVDPDNSRDVALLGYYCSAVINGFACNAESSRLYRSFDGAETWSLVNTPGGEGIGPQVVWVGSDLFVGTAGGIARSIADGPFTLLQQPYFGTGQEAGGRQLFVVGSTLIVQNTSVQDISCGSFCTARSDDRGAHWSLMPMRSHRSCVFGLALIAGDGKTLIGSEVLTISNPCRPGIFRSEDFGATWSPLPPSPAGDSGVTGEFQTAQGMISLAPIIAAPDGSIYIKFNFPGPTSGIGSPSNGIYELAPGALNWRYFAPSSGGNLQIFVWNNAGHLAAIWGDRGSPSVSGFQYRSFNS